MDDPTPQCNASTRRGKQLKTTAKSSPSQESSAQDNTSEDEDVEAGIDNSPLGRTDIGFNKGEGSHREYDSVDLDDQLPRSETDYGLILRSSLSGAQNEKVNELIQKIQPEAVVFVAVMKKGDVQQPSPLLIISKERSLVEAAHFPHESGTTVTLQVPGIKTKTSSAKRIKSKKWQPIFLLQNGEYMLAGNWLGFICDNAVQVGDICIFVPLKDSKSSKFTVHVLPAKATLGIKDAMIVSAVNTEAPSHGGFVSSESNIHGVCNELPDGEDAHGEQRAVILPRFLNLTTSQQKMLEERVQAIQSEYQLYVVTMNKSMDEKDGLQQKQFEFSKKYAVAIDLPTRERKLILWSMGKEWETMMKYRKVKKIYRWMIVDGWGEFARGNGVRETGLCSGDMCIFELKSMNEKEITMEVHVIPKEQF